MLDRRSLLATSLAASWSELISATSGMPSPDLLDGLIGLVIVQVGTSPVPQAGPGPHDRHHYAPLLGLVIVQAVEQALGVGVGGQDIELADRHVARFRLGHGIPPDSCFDEANSSTHPPDALLHIIG